MRGAETMTRRRGRIFAEPGGENIAAAQCLLRTTDPITRIRGREFTYRDAILIPTYHPAYLLRTPSAKREVWEDMKRVREILSGRS